MDENKFWLSIWTLVATVIVALIGSITVAHFNTMDKWDRAVTNGADPMVTSCALFDQTGGEKITCHVLAMNRK